MTASVNAGPSRTSSRIAAGYHVRVLRDWSAVDASWKALAGTLGPTPFQNSGVARRVVSTFGRVPGITPLLVDVRDAASGALVLLLPLVSMRRGASTVITFADDELTDFNAPLLGPRHRVIGLRPRRCGARSASSCRQPTSSS